MFGRRRLLASSGKLLQQSPDDPRSRGRSNARSRICHFWESRPARSADNEDGRRAGRSCWLYPIFAPRGTFSEHLNRVNGE